MTDWSLNTGFTVLVILTVLSVTVSMMVPKAGIVAVRTVLPKEKKFSS